MRKVYEKPYFEVAEYSGDCAYATDSTGTCRYLTCLIGNQSGNSEDIGDTTIYIFTSENGTKYYVWKYTYSSTPSIASDSTYSETVANYGSGNYTTWQSYLNYLVGLLGYSTDGPNWHIATDDDGVYNAS